MDALKKLLFTPIGGAKKAINRFAEEQANRRKRQFPRYRVPVAACARSGRIEVVGTTATLGPGGLFLPCRHPFPTATRLTLTLEDGIGDSDPITAQGTVVYQKDQGMGIRFTGLTVAHTQRLRNLIQLALVTGP